MKRLQAAPSPAGVRRAPSNEAAAAASPKLVAAGMCPAASGPCEERGAALAQGFGRCEEAVAEVEVRGGPVREQPCAALAGDIGEARGDIAAAGEDDCVNPGMDR